VGGLILAVFGAFIAFVVGGWVAGKIAGLQRSEPAMLHSAIAWLVAVPLLMVLATLGAGSFFAGWFGGLAGMPPGPRPRMRRSIRPPRPRRATRRWARSRRSC
jgi:hypothetical protein